MLVEHAESNVFEECSHVIYSVDIYVLLYNLNQEIFRSVLAGNSQIDNVSLNLHLFLEHLLVSDELTVGELEHDLKNLACNQILQNVIQTLRLSHLALILFDLLSLNFKLSSLQVNIVHVDGFVLFIFEEHLLESFVDVRN